MSNIKNESCVLDTIFLWILLRMSKQLACRWNKR